MFGIFVKLIKEKGENAGDAGVWMKDWLLGCG